MLIFEFHIGGYFGTSHDVIYKNDMLVCSRSEISKNEISVDQILHVCNDTDWELLINFLENLKWKERYDDSDVMDGTQWVLKFKNKNNKIKTNGSNSYPRNFKKFLRLLNKVLSKQNAEVY